MLGHSLRIHVCMFCGNVAKMLFPYGFAVCIRQKQRMTYFRLLITMSASDSGKFPSIQSPQLTGLITLFEYITHFSFFNQILLYSCEMNGGAKY